MIDQNETKKAHSIATFRKGVPEQLRMGKVGKTPENGHAESNIITHIEDFDALEQGWKELAGESDTHIFQTFEWNRIWWKHFGANKKLHILAVYTGNKLAGIAPLFEDDVALFGRKIYSCLRFLGSYVSQPEGEPLTGCIAYSDYLDFIIRPGHERIFYVLLLQHFSEIKSAFSEVILDEIPEESTIWNALAPVAGKYNSGLRYTLKQASISPVIILDSTWEGYLDSLNVKDRYNARRYYKRSKLENSNAFNIKKIEHAGELPGVLTGLIRMHQQQWNERGFPGTFSEKRMRDFFTEISTSFYEKDWIQFNMAIPVEEDIAPVAVDVFLTYKNRVYLMHRGMEEDSLYRKLGPGNVLLFARMNEAINEGIKIFDLLRGSEEFKLRMATKINQNRKIIAYAGHRSGRLWPGLVKMYMKILRRARSEKLHIKFVFNGKPFLKGITDYLQFLQRRIKYKYYT